MNEGKYCVNCRHFVNGSIGGYVKVMDCASPKNPKNLVHGTPIKISANLARSISNSFQYCGREGNFFEQKEPDTTKTSEGIMVWLKKFLVFSSST